MRKEKCQCGGDIIRGYQQGGGYTIRCSRCGPSYKVMNSFMGESVVEINFCSNCGTKVSRFNGTKYYCPRCQQTCQDDGKILSPGSFVKTKKKRAVGWSPE